MVRLVFRPYTQVWRSICTSEPLRASTRVSPGFTLLRHSSPSFGSQHIRSHSDLHAEAFWPADRENYHCYFHYAPRFDTSVLAHMLDSLVRVSRRGEEKHFVSITHNCLGPVHYANNTSITPQKWLPLALLLQANQTHTDCFDMPQRPT